MAAGVADRPLPLGVGPAGAVGDQLAVVADQQPADDVPDRAQLRVGGLDQRGADVVPEAEVAAGRLGVAGAGLCPALLVLGGGVTQLVVVEARAGKVRLLPRGRAFVVLEVLVDEVDHEHRVDHPDAGGEVPPSVMREGVTAVAGAVADLGGDAELGGPRPGAGGECVELAIEPVGLAAQDRRELPPSVVVQVRAGVVDPLGGVEQGAVVDPDGVGVLVLDDGAVHERAEVAQRLVVQVAGGDPLGDRLGELRGGLVHVGKLVGHRDRDLLARGSFGDTGADLLWQGELAAQVVRPLGGDAEVGADGDDPVGLAQPGASLPAVLELLLLV